MSNIVVTPQGMIVRTVPGNDTNEIILVFQKDAAQCCDDTYLDCTYCTCKRPLVKFLFVFKKMSNNVATPQDRIVRTVLDNDTNEIFFLSSKRCRPMLSHLISLLYVLRWLTTHAKFLFVFKKMSNDVAMPYRAIVRTAPIHRP